MKNRKEILEADHDSALTQLIENEINVTAMEERVKIMSPGAEYDDFQKQLEVKKTNVENIKRVLAVIENMIAMEGKDASN